jgi:hypothetical protein
VEDTKIKHQNEEDSKASQSRSRLLALVLIILGCSILFISLQKETNKAELSSLSAVSPRSEQIVNKYLKEAHDRIEWQKQKMALENKIHAPQIGEDVVPLSEAQKKNIVTGSLIEPDRNMDVLTNDLSRPTKDRSLSPSDVISSELAYSDEEALALQEYREAYAQEFIKNARRNGYDVRLDKNYRVIDVRPLQRPNSQTAESSSLFESKTTAGQ